MSCEVCGGPLRRDNVIGVCARNESCRKERNRRWGRRPDRSTLRPYDSTAKPEPATCECGEPAKVYERGDGSWKKWKRCGKCQSVWIDHGMTLLEYNDYLASGCAIKGCLEPATHIDHDHSICPQRHHTCEACRRGPLCHSHNTRNVAVLDDLRAGKLSAELAYLGWEVVCVSSQ